MKHLGIFLSALLIVFSLSILIESSQRNTNTGFDPQNCTFNGKPLYGKIKYVKHFPDVKVKVVTSFSDLDVKVVNHFADDCGEWEIVDHFPDLRVQIVDHFQDIKIRYVDNFPGTD